MDTNMLEICIRGKYSQVPSVQISGQNIITRGKVVKVACVYEEEWLSSEIEKPEQFIDKLRQFRREDFKADIFTFTQKLPNTDPKYSYPFEWEPLAVIELNSFEDWWDRQLPQETRKNARRALKRGVEVRVEQLNDELIRKIVELNNSSPLRQGRVFDHYGKSFQQVKKDQSSFMGRSDYICAYSNDELIGFIKTIRCGDTSRMLQIIPKASAYDMRPGTALIVKTVQHCLEIGMKHLVYDKYIYGNKRTSTLTEFKKRHGFQPIPMPRYYVPLSVKGKIAMKLNLHHNIVGILPEPVLQLAITVREKWHKIKFSTAPV